jgi:hypothetical protein
LLTSFIIKLSVNSAEALCGDMRISFPSLPTTGGKNSPNKQLNGSLSLEPVHQLNIFNGLLNTWSVNIKLISLFLILLV